MIHKYKLSDLVYVKGGTRNYTIVDLYPYEAFQDSPIYLLECVVSGLRDFFSETSIELVKDREVVQKESENISMYGWGYNHKSVPLPCTCGAKYVSGGRHSEWCERYKK
jgi:hypothetical protein